MKTVKKKWGREEWIVNNDKYCGKKLVIGRNEISSEGKFHYHRVKDETFYIAKGKLILDYYTNDMIQFIRLVMKKGNVFHVPILMRHRFRGGAFGCTFYEFSTHHEDSDSYYEVHFPSKVISSSNEGKINDPVKEHILKIFGKNTVFKERGV